MDVCMDICNGMYIMKATKMVAKYLHNKKL